MTKLLDDIKNNLLALADADEEDVDLTVKGIVCPFYQKGNAPKCMLCVQKHDKLMECKEEYEEKIPNSPQEVWTPSFDIAKKRAKKAKTKDVFHSIGRLCDSCYLADYCPEYEKNSTCSITFGSKNTSPEIIIDKLIQIQSERVDIARAVEAVDGGIPDAGLSGEIDRMTNLIAVKQDVKADRFSLRIDGSSSGESSKGGGILSQVFGGMLSKNKQEALPEKAESVVELSPMEEAVVLEDTPKRKRRKSSDK